MAMKVGAICERTLSEDIPNLVPYLRPGISVLDVGCGQGTVTTGVAAAVYPGKVVGVDPFTERIEKARELAAESKEQMHLHFEVADSHNLPFSDESFDLVYTHTVMHFVVEPERALNEQMRVTKENGWVVASGVRDHLACARWPECPNWEKVIRAFEPYNQSILDEFRDSGLGAEEYYRKQFEVNPHYAFRYDVNAGRKCPEWFSRIGVAEPRIVVSARRVQYQGTDTISPGPIDLVVLKEAESAQEKLITGHIAKMIERGFVDRATVERAKQEAGAWYRHPGAFNFFVEVFAAGKKKAT